MYKFDLTAISTYLTVREIRISIEGRAGAAETEVTRLSGQWDQKPHRLLRVGLQQRHGRGSGGRRPFTPRRFLRGKSIHRNDGSEGTQDQDLN